MTYLCVGGGLGLGWKQGNLLLLSPHHQDDHGQARLEIMKVNEAEQFQRNILKELLMY